MRFSHQSGFLAAALLRNCYKVSPIDDTPPFANLHQSPVIHHVAESDGETP